MSVFSRLGNFVARAPLVSALTGSLALHAAVLVSLHFGWQIEAPSPAAETYAIVTIEAPHPVDGAAPPPEPAAELDSGAVASPAPDSVRAEIHAPPPPVPEPATGPMADPGPPVPQQTAEAIVSPPVKPTTPDPRIEAPPMFKAPPRKPEMPLPENARQSPTLEEPGRHHEAPSPPVRSAALSAPAKTGEAERFEPPLYGVPGLANPRPRYPWLSRQKGEEGRVVLRVRVDRDGAAKQVYVVQTSGHGRLDRAAQQTVEKWRFQPARRAGREVAGHVDVPVTFRLSEY